MENKIIIPTHAIFKEGEVYVYQLPEEPFKCNCITTTKERYRELGDNCPLHPSACPYWQNKELWKEAVAYAREHPIKVDEKDKEKVKYKMCPCHNCRPDECDHKFQDLTEYKLEGVRMEITRYTKGMVDAMMELDNLNEKLKL